MIEAEWSDKNRARRVITVLTARLGRSPTVIENSRGIRIQVEGITIEELRALDEQEG